MSKELSAEFCFTPFQHIVYFLDDYREKLEHEDYEELLLKLKTKIEERLLAEDDEGDEWKALI